MEEWIDSRLSMGRVSVVKDDVGVVFGLCYSKNDMKLLLQELSTETLMKSILFGEKMTNWWRRIIKQGNLKWRLILTFDYTSGYLNMNRACLLFFRI